MTDRPRTDEREAPSSIGMFSRFFNWEAAGSAALVAASAVALVWANSPWRASYFHLEHVPISVSFDAATYRLSLQHWINDLLMAVFFFLVGLEIKREVIAGQLSSWQKAALPVMAALGGVLAPAGLYWLFNGSGPGARGWAIPMATDIAFALGVLAAFGRRTPVGLRVFLAALAIADDLLAVLVIAVFYSTEGIRLGALAIGLALMLVLVFVARSGIRRPGAYLMAGLFVWAAVTASNLHPTLAGVLVAMTIPVRAQGNVPALGQIIEDELHPIVAFVILPLFAFFNAGVAIDASLLRTLVQPVPLGIIVGLILGKQAGIMLFSWLAVKSGWAALPERVTWGEIYAGACLGGIGFTMSLFITDLAFTDDRLTEEAKLAILVASFLAAVWGSVALHLTLSRSGKHRKEPS